MNIIWEDKYPKVSLIIIIIILIILYGFFFLERKSIPIYSFYLPIAIILLPIISLINYKKFKVRLTDKEIIFGKYFYYPKEIKIPFLAVKSIKFTSYSDKYKNYSKSFSLMGILSAITQNFASIGVLYSMREKNLLKITTSESTFYASISDKYSFKIKWNNLPNVPKIA